MNKNAIKTFSIWARRKLIEDAVFRAGLIGITEQGIASPLPQSTGDLQFFDIGTKVYAEVSGGDISRRNALVAAIRAKAKELDYKEAFQYVMEEVAYTWFNRLIAIRFMEVNDYLPHHVRVLSSQNPAKLEPDIVTSPFDTDFEFTQQERDVILEMKDENKLDELFRMLFIRQCAELGKILPELFYRTDDYTELLLSISYMDKEGVVYKLTHDIEEKDFNVVDEDAEGQVEIIGWLYQYYNTEPKDAAFAKKGAILKEDIPAVTQLFTPDWIVRYMVENSLGRLWLDGHPDDELKAGWKYYLDEAEQTPEVEAQLAEIRKEHAALNPEDIRLIDPCMGSGHILVYAFDVLMQIYLSQGYGRREAAESILRNNLYGIDIDPRAYQLAYFAVMMKARQYSRRIFSEGILPNLMAVRNAGSVPSSAMKRLGAAQKTAERLLEDYREAEEFGSILNIEYTEAELTALEQRLNELEEERQSADILAGADIDELLQTFRPLVRQARIMGQKYHVTVTNPPYMAPTPKQKPFVEKYFPASKADLFAVFIEKCGMMLMPNGYQAMITQQQWMFLSSFKDLRRSVRNKTIINLCQLGPRAFDEISGDVVQTSTFVLNNAVIDTHIGTYFRLVNINSQAGKEKAFLEKNAVFYARQTDFSRIPDAPIAYWVSEKTLELFGGKLLGDYAETKQGFATGNNDMFLRLWHEVPISNSCYDSPSADAAKKTQAKWFPCNKGGSFRRWYGNNFYVANWQYDGQKMREFSGSVIRNPQFYFRDGVTWSSLSNVLSMRYSPTGFIFESKGSMCFVKNHAYLNYLLGLVNTKVVDAMLAVLSPTLDYHEGPMAKVPFVLDEKYEPIISADVKNNIELSRDDWDAFETSWDFVRHPMIRSVPVTPEERMVVGAFGNDQVLCPAAYAFGEWMFECEERFDTLKRNEEELNRIFIDIYGLQDELTPEVEDKDVTVRKADLGRDIRSFISYAVGCMFGRYSLDCDGLAYAGGEWDDSKYVTYVPDKDNCIPITDTAYFEDDIVSRFVQFVRSVYGEANLEDNLRFIADALGNKGDTAREVIRNYFLNDFYKDHLKIYQKRPIYWLFDSGKQNGFKALVYMHRWNADTVGTVRADYLERMQRKLDSEVERMDSVIEGGGSAREISKAEKQKEKLRRQQKECVDYAQRLAHIANYRPAIDLDDGVKVNYRKVQTDPSGKFFEILAASKDIMAKEK